MRESTRSRGRGARSTSRRSVIVRVGIGVATLALIGTVSVGLPAILPEAATLESLTYTDLITALSEDRVQSLTVHAGREIQGTWRVAPGAETLPNRPAEFSVVYPLDASEALLTRAADNGVQVDFVAARPPAGRRLLTFALQLTVLGLIACLLIVMLRGRAGEQRIGERGEGGDTRFADVAGTQGAAEELREVVDFLQKPAAFADMGARVPRGVLLFGPPGTGKTLLARAVAGEARKPFFYLSGSEVTGFVVGLGAHRIRALFRKARRKGGVIFIDELDALGGTRGRNGSHNEDDRTLNQLLVELDGFRPADGVVVIGATNRPESLDPALRRPGRFDRQIAVTLPTSAGREAILRLHVERRGVPTDNDVDFGRLARLTPGSSGAELANLINEAAIAAVRAHADRVAWEHLEWARDRLALGAERKGMSVSADESRVVAVHEAGHAIAGIVACPQDGLHKVTVRPRGGSLGVAHFAPDADRYLHSRTYMEAQIIKALGGRAAEEIVLGVEHITAGSERDLEQANRIARHMVYKLGMGDCGLLVHVDEDSELSAEAHASLDNQVRDLLDRLYGRTKALLAERRPALDELAAALTERETLDGEEVRALLDHAPARAAGEGQS